MTKSPFDDMPPADLSRPPMVRPPIRMILFCPSCGVQHVDAPAPPWTNPPHRSHLCAGCGHIWRPADVETAGVAEIATKGQDDSRPIRRLIEERGTGRTTKQMREAPAGAVFVWNNDHLEYPRHVARVIGRPDLKIIGPRGLDRIRPPLAGIVVDHAASLSHQQHALFMQLLRLAHVR